MTDKAFDIHHAKMIRAFERVENPVHWKGPVAGFVNAADVDVVCEAVSYFTATVAKVTPGPIEGRYHVTSPGYRAGPAGDA